MRRLRALAVLAGVLMAVGAGAVPALATTTPPAIHWGPCSQSDLEQAGAQCGWVSVPLDYAKPSGRHIEIAVSRVRHTSSPSAYRGVILVNPGGPGGSGLDLETYLVSALQQEGYAAAAADYDWIGFDPRGVGSSVPAITCDPNYLGPDRPNYVPATTRLLDTWLSRSRTYARDCTAHGALRDALLHHLSTADNARDLDTIRRALGQARISYYGFSWGTALGQAYATLFPTHLRRLILDSNVNPLVGDYQANLDQDAPFDRNLDRWFAWLARYHAVYHLGRTETAVRQAFRYAEQGLSGHPAGGVVGPDEWADVFLEPGYDEGTWVQFGQAFSDWVTHHNAAAADELTSLYEATDTPGDDNELAVYLGVECTSSPWPRQPSRWTRDSWAIFRVAPLEVWGNTWFNGPCLDWPAAPQRGLPVDGRRVPGALLIDETLDAATPFSGSLAVRRLFPHSALVAEPGGTSHADSLNGDRCVDSTIAAYLVTGALPPRRPRAAWDRTCAPLPQPVPPSTGAAAAADRADAAQALAQAGRPVRPSSLPPVRIHHWAHLRMRWRVLLRKTGGIATRAPRRSGPLPD